MRHRAEGVSRSNRARHGAWLLVLIVPATVSCTSNRSPDPHDLRYCLRVNALIEKFDKLQTQAPSVVSAQLVRQTTTYANDFHELAVEPVDDDHISGLVQDIADAADAYGLVVIADRPTEDVRNSSPAHELIDRFESLQHTCFGPLPTPDR